MREIRAIIAGQTVRLWAEERWANHAAELMSSSFERPHLAIFLEEHGGYVIRGDGKVYDHAGVLPDVVVQVLDRHQS